MDPVLIGTYVGKVALTNFLLPFATNYFRRCTSIKPQPPREMVLCTCRRCESLGLSSSTSPRTVRSSNTESDGVTRALQKLEIGSEVPAKRRRLAGPSCGKSRVTSDEKRRNAGRPSSRGISRGRTPLEKKLQRSSKLAIVGRRVSRTKITKSVPVMPKTLPTRRRGSRGHGWTHKKAGKKALALLDTDEHEKSIAAQMERVDASLPVPAGALGWQAIQNRRRTL